MLMTKVPAAFLVIGAISLGAPAMAAPITPLSATAKPTVQEKDATQVRWHWGHWHGGSYRCAPYCRWGG